MIGLGSTFNFQESQASQATASFDIQQAIAPQVYSLTFEVIKEHEAVFSALSNYSLLCLDINTLKNLCHIPDAHTKRINALHFAENLLYTCSNDGSIKVWDTKAGTSPVAQLRSPSVQPLYSLTQTKHILAGGTEGNIHFWDLRTQKILNTFAETHVEEVTALQFSKDKSNILLSASLDGIVCLFDLSKGDEEESADTILRLEQPINSCKFFGGDFSVAFAQTTVQTINLLSLEHAKMVREINTIENLDTNQFALLGAYDLPNDPNLYYLRGNLEGYIEEYGINLVENSEAKLLNKFYTPHVGPITKAERITNEHVISSGEDGKFYVTQNTKVEDVFDFEQAKKAMFYEDDNTTDASNQDSQNNNLNGKRNKKLERFGPY